MTFDELRSNWDLKYEQGLPSLEKPDPFYVSAFAQFVADQFPNNGAALDLAVGIGRHALWLAKRNWQVTVVDISEVAIRKLGQKAQQLNLTLDLLTLDAREYQFKPACFDLIVMFYHFDRDICSRVLSALKPGGFLICKSSLSWDSYEGAATVSIRPLERSEILSMLPGLRVLHHQERRVRDRGVVEYVGKKPSNIAVGTWSARQPAGLTWNRTFAGTAARIQRRCRGTVALAYVARHSCLAVVLCSGQRRRA